MLEKRFKELSDNAYYNGTYYFTNFLSLPEQSLLYQSVDKKNLAVFGGMEDCERVVCRFGNEEELGYQVAFPISLLKVEPLILKFADKLSHRDFLGALMNLGIEREMIGDIIIKDKVGYIFVIDRMAEYIITELTQVKRTHIKISIVDEINLEIKREYKEKAVLVSSKRIDLFVAKECNLSRSKALELFQDKKIFINGKIMENNSYILKPEDVITIRGYGKYIFEGEMYETKKGKICLKIKEYV